ncbi:MAG TPA: sugar-binding domain-containing protein [Thermoanaerobaculia bacterium]|jgi:DNA-binding transcriptional regulator LsrR (DeoR family)
MARLNISLPDDLYEAAKKWRGTMNLSEICAKALRAELEAAELDRLPGGLLWSLKPPSRLEKTLAKRFGLKAAVITDTPEDPLDLPEVLGSEAARYLDSHLSDDALLAIAGGRQMWRVVRNLSQRSIRITITALGIHENDPQVLHVHPNTLTTLLWLLYSPGAVAKLVAAGTFDSLWRPNLPVKERPSYFVVASCGPFQNGSPFANLIGPQATRNLLERGASGDFAYIFFDKDGQLLEPPDYRVSPTNGIDHSLFSAQQLRDLSKRPDACVLAVAGGESKVLPLRHALDNQLCNVVVTDHDTATELLC